MSAMIHPINVQPSRRFSTAIGFSLWCFRLLAIIVGIKYRHTLIKTTPMSAKVDKFLSILASYVNNNLTLKTIKVKR
jgi:hypothetical protein